MNPASPRHQMLFLVLLVLTATQLAIPQTTPPQDKAPESFSDFLKQRNAPTDLAACQSKLQEWKDWGATNVPKNTELIDEYAKLKTQYTNLDSENDKLQSENDKLNEELGWQWFFVAAAAGAGIVIMIYVFNFLKGVVQHIRRLGPIPPTKKQLFLLLGTAAWVTLIVLTNADTVGRHPIDALAAVLFWSLPVFLLVGIVFWWDRTKQRVI